MKHERRILYFRQAIALCGIDMNTETADLVIQMNDVVLKDKGDTGLRKIAKMIVYNKKKYKTKKTKKKPKS